MTEFDLGVGSTPLHFGRELPSMKRTSFYRVRICCSRRGPLCSSDLPDPPEPSSTDGPQFS